MDDGIAPQVFITWAEVSDAEPGAAHLAQLLGAPGAWWYIRKHPGWRLRYERPLTRAHLDTALERLRQEGVVADWAHGIYEPETAVFGGHEAMEAAHELFRADSAHLVDYFSALERLRPGDAVFNRREQGALLITALLLGAGLDWYEQADVWARVARTRGPDTLSGHLHLAADMRRLLAADHTRLAERGMIPKTWLDAFTTAGEQLAALAYKGRLERGLRAVLAHHVLFHFNRMGLARSDQHNLSLLAKEAVLTDDAHLMRNALVDSLKNSGALDNQAVEQAMRAVERHAFVPGATLAEAYADDAVHIKHTQDGASLSCASQPRIVAGMLGQLDARPGHRVLELGAGSGYNAALLDHLVTPGGSVVTVDVEADLVEGAAEHLARAGAGAVTTVQGDGAMGHAEGAPYDRIIATVGAHAIPEAWFDQLAPAGRAVTPVRIAGDVSRSIAWRRDGRAWVSEGSLMCTFMPLRGGVGDDARRIIDLTGDGQVVVQANKDQQASAAELSGVLHSPSHTEWSGVVMGKGESLEWVWLWLACTLPNRLSRMPVKPEAASSGLVEPMFGWGSMATVEEGSLAYLTARPVEGGSEIGAIGHGPRGKELAMLMAEGAGVWDARHRGREASFSYHLDGKEAPQAEPWLHLVPRPGGVLAVHWK